jgi:hypothetical protein
MKRFVFPVLCLLVTTFFPGCSKDTRVNLEVLITKDGETVPVSNVKFDILPYDVTAARDSLARMNNPGEPPARDSLLEARARYEEMLSEYEKTLDVLEDTERELKEIKDTRSAAYRKAYNDHEKAKKTNDDMYEKKEKILKEYLAQKELYDTELQEWEDRAYRGFDDYVAAVREKRKITDDYLIKTDKEGRGSVVVPGGDWWVRGKVRNPNQTYTVYFWNQKIDLKGGTLSLELNTGNAQVIEE